MNDHMPVVKMYKEETVCCECGRHIKNVVEIDGAQYGTGCCEKHLPRHYSVKKGAVVVNVAAMKAAAEAIMGARFIPFWIKSEIELDDYVNKADAAVSDIRSENLKGIALIQAIRRAWAVNLPAAAETAIVSKTIVSDEIKTGDKVMITKGADTGVTCKVIIVGTCIVAVVMPDGEYAHFMRDEIAKL